MVVKPKFRGFICTTAHPEGCAYNVRQQIEYVKNQKQIQGPVNVLVIGSSTGYGLASRITAAFGAKCPTIGVFYERPASGNRTATAGWYNTAAFEAEAQKSGIYAKSINGDAFSNEIKQQTIELIKKDLGKVDLVVYSLASPRRTHPVSGETLNSVLKPIGKPYTNKTVDFHTKQVSEITIEPATEEEIKQTVSVMGGEDWELWINELNNAGALAEGAVTIAYSYIGPELTHAVYREGTIGRAKDHLEATAKLLSEKLAPLNGKAYVSVNKALVTQSSSAIPVVPLYVAILYRIMKNNGTHEGCIEQIYRLFTERLYGDQLELDDKGRIRVDDLEMVNETQKSVSDLWDSVDSSNIDQITDIEGFRREFFHLFGFDFNDIDYEADVEIEIPIASIRD